MRTIDEVKAEIEELENGIDQFELDPDDYTDLYDEALNEGGPVRIGGLTFDPADIVKEMDPTAYRCGLNDFVDSMELEDSDEYREMLEQLEELQDELTDLENEEE